MKRNKSKGKQYIRCRVILYLFCRRFELDSPQKIDESEMSDDP